MATSEEKNVKNMTNTVKKFSEQMLAFIEALLSFGKTNDKYHYAEQLGKKLESGKYVIYQIKGNEADLLKLMERSGLSHDETYREIARTMGNNNTILIKTSDLEKVVKLNFEALASRCNYFVSLEGSKLETSLAKNPNIKSKELLELKDLNDVEFKILRDKCNLQGRNITVGVDTKKLEQSACTDVLLHSSTVYNNSHTEGDLCKAYLEMALTLYGPNGPQKLKEAREDDKFDKQLLEKIENLQPGDTIIINDRENPHHYMEITTEGVKTYQEIDANNGAEKESILKATIDKEQFFNKSSGKYDLTSYYAHIMVMNDELKSKELFEKQGSDTAEDRALNARKWYHTDMRRNRRENTISTFQDKFADAMDVAIKEANADKVWSDCEQAFNDYKKNVSDILSALKNDTIPTNLKVTDDSFNKLKGLLEEYQEVISINHLDNVKSFFDSDHIESHHRNAEDRTEELKRVEEEKMADQTRKKTEIYKRKKEQNKEHHKERTKQPNEHEKEKNDDRGERTL